MASLVDKYFSRLDFDAIEAAVKKAESSSGGEIAVELSSHSKHWITERLIHSLVLTLMCMVVALFLTRDHNWGVYYNTTQVILWGAVGFVVAWFGWGLFLKRASRARQIVWKRAVDRFLQLKPTRGLTGVLIFVSLEENHAAIVADKGIASKMSSDYWDKPHAMIIDSMKQGKHAEGIIKAIDTIAVELAQHFPRANDDIDELPDKPTVID